MSNSDCPVDDSKAYSEAETIKETPVFRPSFDDIQELNGNLTETGRRLSEADPALVDNGVFKRIAGSMGNFVTMAMESARSTDPSASIVKVELPGTAPMYIIGGTRALTEVMMKPFAINKLRQLEIVPWITGGGFSTGPIGSKQFIVTVPSGEEWIDLKPVNDIIGNARFIKSCEAGVANFLEEILQSNGSAVINNKVIRDAITLSVTKALVPSYNPSLEEASEDSSKIASSIERLTNILMPCMFLPDILIQGILRLPYVQDTVAMFNQISDKIFSIYKQSSQELETQDGILHQLLQFTAYKDNIGSLRSLTNLISEAAVGSTVSATMSVLLELWQNPSLIDRIQNKTLKIQDLIYAASLKAVPVYVTFRGAADDTIIDGYHIPKNTRVILSLEEALKRVPILDDDINKYFQSRNGDLANKDQIKNIFINATLYEADGQRYIDVVNMDINDILEILPILKLNHVAFIPWLNVDTEGFDATMPNRKCSGQAFAIKMATTVIETLINKATLVAGRNFGKKRVATQSEVVDTIWVHKHIES